MKYCLLIMPELWDAILFTSWEWGVFFFVILTNDLCACNLLRLIFAKKFIFTSEETRRYYLELFCLCFEVKINVVTEISTLLVFIYRTWVANCLRAILLLLRSWLMRYEALKWKYLLNVISVLTDGPFCPSLILLFYKQHAWV